jgi:hypothetical protein
MHHPTIVRFVSYMVLNSIMAGSLNKGTVINIATANRLAHFLEHLSHTKTLYISKPGQVQRWNKLILWCMTSFQYNRADLWILCLHHHFYWRIEKLNLKGGQPANPKRWPILVTDILHFYIIFMRWIVLLQAVHLKCSWSVNSELHYRSRG